MARVKSEETLDTDRLIGQCLGAGMSVERASQHVGLSANTVHRHIDGNKQYIFKIKNEVEAILALNTAKSVVAASVKAETRIQNVFDRALVLTEKAIQKAEDKGDDITLDELMEIHNKITVWSSKFAASEAPKKLEVDNNVRHTHELGGEVWDRIEALQRKMVPVATPKALPVIDV